jgi:hypothetical protein
VIALVLAAVLAGQVPSPPTEWTRADVEKRWGPASFSGPLEAPWAEGSTVASYVQRADDVDGLCRVHAATKRGLRWIALVYYTPGDRLVSVHCLRLDDLDTGHDVLPDVVRRLRGGRT